MHFEMHFENFSDELQTIYQTIYNYITSDFITQAQRGFEAHEEELNLMRLMLIDEEASAIKALPERASFYQSQDLIEHQARHTQPIKNLKYYLTQKISIQRTHDIPVRSNPNHLPLSLLYRKDKILKINDFPDSRIMYLYHDLIDHIFVFNLLNQNHIFERFHSFFVQHELPHQAPLYSRSSEYVSGIGFAYRHFSYHAIPPSTPHTRQVLCQYLASCKEQIPKGYASDLQSACSLLETSTVQSNRVSAIIFNVLAQLVDERRTWGSPKSLSFSQEASSQVISLVDPVYLLFLVQASLCLYENHHICLSFMSKTLCLIDEIITQLVQSPLGATIYITFDQIIKKQAQWSHADIQRYLPYMTQY